MSFGWFPCFTPFSRGGDIKKLSASIPTPSLLLPLPSLFPLILLALASQSHIQGFLLRASTSSRSVIISACNELLTTTQIDRYATEVWLTAVCISFRSRTKYLALSLLPPSAHSRLQSMGGAIAVVLLGTTVLYGCFCLTQGKDRHFAILIFSHTISQRNAHSNITLISKHYSYVRPFRLQIVMHEMKPQVSETCLLSRQQAENSMIYSIYFCWQWLFFSFIYMPIKPGAVLIKIQMNELVYSMLGKILGIHLIKLKEQWWIIIFKCWMNDCCVILLDANNTLCILVLILPWLSVSWYL